MRDHCQMSLEMTFRQYVDLSENPGGYCPTHATGVKLPDSFVITPLQYVD